eukprot:3952638-Lingulodinium_polyedra.AAC.1
MLCWPTVPRRQGSVGSWRTSFGRSADGPPPQDREGPVGWFGRVAGRGERRGHRSVVRGLSQRVFLAVQM